MQKKELLLGNNFLGDYLLNLFQKSNSGHRRYFVFELGKRGFYAEISTVARAAIYAHIHELQLVLKNDQFGFLSEHGWSDYYLPFCADYDEQMDNDVAVFCSACLPVRFMKEILAHRPEVLKLDFIEMQGFDNILYFFMNMLGRPNLNILKAHDAAKELIKLPIQYSAIHIRRGDKVGSEDTFYPVNDYLNQIINSPFARLPIFVMSDDYRAIIELQTELSNSGLENELYTLCNPANSGFDVWELRKSNNAYNHDNGKKTANINFQKHVYENAKTLLVETFIASKSKIFVGTYKSNVTWAVYALHQMKENCIRLRNTDLFKN